MKNLSFQNKLLVSTAVVLGVFALLFFGLKMQLNAFRVSSPKKVVIEQTSPSSDSGEVLGDSNDGNYINPLEGIYVNPFSN